MKKIQLLIILLTTILMANTILASDLSDYSEMFFDEDGSFNALIVVGDKAPATDVIAAMDIAMGLQYGVIEGINENMEQIDVGSAIIASKIEGEEYDHNLIAIGQPCNNLVVNKLLGNPEYVCDTLPENEGMIKLFQYTGNIQLIVTGGSDYAIRSAATVLANYENYDLEGDEMSIVVTEVQEIEVEDEVIVISGEAVVMDLFKMSFDPFAQELEETLYELVEDFDGLFIVEPYFIIYEGEGDRCFEGYCSLRGKNEVMLDLVEACVYEEFSQYNYFEFVNYLDETCYFMEDEESLIECLDEADIEYDVQSDFENCLDDWENTADENVAMAQEYEVFGSPTMFIGEDMYVGTRDYDSLKELICEELGNEPEICEVQEEYELRVIMAEDETRTYSLNGRDYEIEIYDIDEDEARIAINGDSEYMEEGECLYLENVILCITDILTGGYQNLVEFTLTVQSNVRHDLSIEHIETYPEDKVNAGEYIIFRLLLWNDGQKDEQDISIKIEIPELDVYTYEYIYEIEAGEYMDSGMVALQIPYDAEEGTYDMYIDVEYDEGYETVSTTRQIEVVRDIELEDLWSDIYEAIENIPDKDKMSYSDMCLVINYGEEVRQYYDIGINKYYSYVRNDWRPYCDGPSSEDFIVQFEGVDKFKEFIKNPTFYNFANGEELGLFNFGYSRFVSGDGIQFTEEFKERYCGIITANTNIMQRIVMGLSDCPEYAEKRITEQIEEEYEWMEYQEEYAEETEEEIEDLKDEKEDIKEELIDAKEELWELEEDLEIAIEENDSDLIEHFEEEIEDLEDYIDDLEDEKEEVEEEIENLEDNLENINDSFEYIQEEIESTYDGILSKKDLGKIKFTNFVDLRGLPEDYANHIQIGKGKISIDTEAIPQLANQRATITMEGLSFSNTPKIRMDGKDCGNICSNIQYDKTTGTLIFDVEHFTTFEVVADIPAFYTQPYQQENKPSNKAKVEKISIPEEIVKSGDELIIGVNVKNTGDFDLAQLKATMVIPELGIRRQSGHMDIDKEDELTKWIMEEIPEGTTPGEYDVKITISNDELRRVKHRVITVE